MSRNEDASKKMFVATGILVFDFELFIGGLFHVVLCGTRINRPDICFTGLYIPVVYYTCRIFFTILGMDYIIGYYLLRMLRVNLLGTHGCKTS